MRVVAIQEPSQLTICCDWAQIDDKLLQNADLVQKMISENPFPPPSDAALDAPAPTDADHDVSAQSLHRVTLRY